MLPATVGGDAYRMALVMGEVGPAAAVRSVLCDRFVALGILVALTAALTPLMAWRFGLTAAVVSVIGASVLGLLALAAIVLLAPHVARLPWVGTALSAVAYDMRRTLSARGDGFLASLLGLATHLLAVGLIFTLALSVKASISALDCLLIVPPALLVSALPVSLGGWGIREGAFLAGFSMAGAEAAAGVAVSILFGASGMFLGALSAVLALLFNAWSTRRANE
jgi:uncharacterized membrane protein YbhN (UPF0104 family)